MSNNMSNNTKIGVFRIVSFGLSFRFFWFPETAELFVSINGYGKLKLCVERERENFVFKYPIHDNYWFSNGESTKIATKIVMWKFKTFRQLLSLVINSFNRNEELKNYFICWLARNMSHQNFQNFAKNILGDHYNEICDVTVFGDKRAFISNPNAKYFLSFSSYFLNILANGNQNDFQTFLMTEEQNLMTFGFKKEGKAIYRRLYYDKNSGNWIGKCQNINGEWIVDYINDKLLGFFNRYNYELNSQQNLSHMGRIPNNLEELACSSSSSDDLKKEFKFSDEKSEEGDVELCVVCEYKEKHMLFIPCAHQVCCDECGENLEKCPMCRSDIKQKIKPFRC